MRVAAATWLILSRSRSKIFREVEKRRKYQDDYREAMTGTCDAVEGLARSQRGDYYVGGLCGLTRSTRNLFSILLVVIVIVIIKLPVLVDVVIKLLVLVNPVINSRTRIRRRKRRKKRFPTCARSYKNC